MSMVWIRKNYGVPARRGARIEYRGDGGISAGTIVTSRGQYLGVRFDGGKRIATLHPTWCVKYLDDPAQAGMRDAAPELLDVAVRLVQFCDANPPAGEALHFVGLAREAIAKATGEAP